MGRKYAVYPSGCVALLGFPLVLLHQGQAPMEYRCETCDCRFGKRTALAKFDLLLLILILTAFVVAILVAVFMA